MAISPVQFTLADDFGEDGHGVKCQMNQAQPNPSTGLASAGPLDQSALNNCRMDHDENCLDHPACVAHAHFTSLQSSHSFLFSARAATQLKFKIDNEAILTHYPELFKRPPKV